MSFLSCVLACCTSVSSPKHTWDAKDQQALDRARITCSTGGSRNECVVKFRRIEESIYEAICGEDNH